MKHTKSLNGCWTCRTRKIKCDEQRPACRQCHKRGYVCEGYDVRLRWLAPETGPVCANEPQEVVREAIQRRQLPLEHPASILTSEEIECILKLVDAPRDSHLFGSAADETRSIHCFGAFRAVAATGKAAVNNGWRRGSQNQPPEPGTDHPDHTDTPEGSNPPADAESLHDDDAIDTVESVSTGVTPNSTGVGGHATSTWSYADSVHTADYMSVTDHQLTLSSLDSNDWLLAGRHLDGGDGLLSLVAAVTAASHHQQVSSVGAATAADAPLPAVLSSALSASDGWVPTPVNGDKEIDSGIASPSPRPGPTVIRLNSQEQYLMRYYMDKVVQLSCVFDNAKSPWKTIHLPRALQGIGELGVGRPTSTIRSALRNDLLSISAFQLSNHHRFEKRLDDAEMWSRAASRYRGEAITLLNHAVTHDLDPRSRPKYKDFLATMLSMISINVMSGDTSTCGVHLDGAAQLISHMRNFKSDYSAKARALHRIYCYVRLIYESTAPRPASPGLQIQRTLHLQSLDLLPNSPFLSIREPSKQTAQSSLDLSSYECVYGIPQPLLAFMKKSIQVIDQVAEIRRKSGGNTSMPSSLALQCDELENELLDWDVDEYLPAADTHCDVNTNIIRHQTLAFHNALIIYLSQHVRLLNHRYIHPYIEAVIRNIEEIEKLKTMAQILGAPLYWPVFIAASEAYDKRLQERFRRWYSEVERYGIEAVKTGVQVIYQVWDEGPVANRTTCAWRRITQRAGITLMLT